MAEYTLPPNFVNLQAEREKRRIEERIELGKRLPEIPLKERVSYKEKVRSREPLQKREKAYFEEIEKRYVPQRLKEETEVLRFKEDMRKRGEALREERFKLKHPALYGTQRIREKVGERVVSADLSRLGHGAALRRAARGFAGLLVPGANTQRYSGEGRPRGTYKHIIPGVGPVHVYEWRKWKRAQRRLQQMRMQQQIARMQQQQTQSPQQQQFQQISDPIAMRILQQRRMAMQQQQQQFAQPIQQQQFQKTILSPQNNNILNAPNIFKGELRNIGMLSPIQGLDNTERPVTNPHGDQYIDIDPISGRPVLKRRIRERWLSSNKPEEEML